MANDTVEPRSATPRFPFDPVYKALCCHRRTLRDMLQVYLVRPHGPLRRELIAALDLDSLRKVSMEWVTREFHLRRGDQVWQVSFSEAARSRGYPAFLLVNLEFQSRSDGQMALRFLEQGGELVRELRAQEAISGGEPCPVLCIVLHNGRSPWTAATSVGALVNLPLALGELPAVPEDVAAFYPWGYWPIDFGAHRGRPHIPGNVLSMIIGIEFARERSDLVAPLWETARNLGDDDLSDTVARWLRRLDERYNLALPGMEELLAMQDVTVLTSRLDETIEEWQREAVARGRLEGRNEGLVEGRSEGLVEGRSEGLVEGRNEGLVEGRNEGLVEGRHEGLVEGRHEGLVEGRTEGLAEAIVRERALLRRMVVRRFGPEGGEEVGLLLEEITDWEQLAMVGEWILDAREATELRDRVVSLPRGA